MRREAAAARRLLPEDEQSRVKGAILAGGSGSRLAPLTRITNKHLLPLYDRPMVTYAVEALAAAGIGEVVLVTGKPHAGEFHRRSQGLWRWVRVPLCPIHGLFSQADRASVE